MLSLRGGGKQNQGKLIQEPESWGGDMEREDEERDGIEDRGRDGTFTWEHRLEFSFPMEIERDWTDESMPCLLLLSSGIRSMDVLRATQLECFIRGGIR